MKPVVATANVSAGFVTVSMFYTQPVTFATIVN